MPKIKHNSPAALAWARALLELAVERKLMQPVGADLGQIAAIARQDRAFGRFLADPSISQPERGALLAKVFNGQVAPLLSDFLGVMNARNALGILAEVSDAYHDLMDEKLGKIEVDLTVAQPLSPQDLSGVRQRISDALHKDAVVRQKVDDRIIGGMVLRIGDRLIDGSVKAQLDAMRHQLLTAPQTAARTNQ